MIRFFHFENTANNNSSTILYKNLRLYMLCINGNTLLRCFTTAILIHVKIQNDISLWRYLWSHLQFKDSFFKS
ncbi:hypothetical protein A1D30_07610 [Acidovorax sp. GW101-3H11]|nr:hypothetical protein A1D30_07610 [Acidovorax sp. GW101-3H11]